MDVMNVFGDQLLALVASGKVSHAKISATAKKHLALIEISKSDLDVPLRQKCAALWQILNESL